MLNFIAPTVSAGYALQYSVPTTASFQQQVLWLVLLPPMRAQCHSCWRNARLGSRRHVYGRWDLKPEPAQQVAEPLMAHDALAARARDELGSTEIAKARPLQAALISAITERNGFCELVLTNSNQREKWTKRYDRIE